MLQGEGYEVFEASDGMQALQMLSEKPVDLAIVDLFLPGVTGSRLLRKFGIEARTRRFCFSPLTVSIRAPKKLKKFSKTIFWRKPFLSKTY